MKRKLFHIIVYYKKTHLEFNSIVIATLNISYILPKMKK